MTRSEFLQELRQALENDLSGSIVQENVQFYNQYITDEMAKGKSEEEVLQMLGDPWIIARTVIDAADGTDKSTVYEAGGGSYTGYESGREQAREQNPKVHVFGLNTWWKKLLLILGIVMMVVAVFAIISGVISLLAPILVPILIIMIVIRFIGNRRG
ncbi:DUF1700 domain-containing protein [Faecalicatena orotica]|uniref:DUF1700 domain-containing protein n=1 Tax=Faecalicatena orotica TaxID=1544 RepID=UPI0032164C8D